MYPNLAVAQNKTLSVYKHVTDDRVQCPFWKKENMGHVSIFAPSTHIVIEVLLTEKDASRKLELDMIASKINVPCDM